MVSNVFLIVLLVYGYTEGYGFTTNIEYPHYTGIMSDAVINSIRYFSSWYSTTIYVRTQYSDRKHRQKQMDVVNEIMKSTMNKFVYKVEHGRALNDAHYRIHNIFLIDTYKSFQKVTSHITSSAKYAHLGFYIVVVTEIMANFEEIFKKIFQDFWGLYTTNVYIIYENSEGDAVLFYTYFPFTEQHCRKIVPVVYNTFNGTDFEKDIPLFPIKTKNFYGCPFNIVTWHSPPQIFLTRTPSGMKVTGGVDGHLLEALAQRLNFTLKYIVAPKDSRQGAIYANGTTTGAMKMIIDKLGDFTISGIGDTLHTENRVSTSQMYLLTYLVLAVPRPNSYSALQKFFFPFGKIVWILFSICLFSTFVIVTISRLYGVRCKRFIAGYNNLSPLLNMIYMLFGGSIQALPKTTFARTLFVLWLFASTILRNSYQGALVGFLQKDEAKAAPNTLKDFLNSHNPIYVTYPKAAMLRDHHRLQKRFVIVPDILPYLRELQNPDFHGAVLCTELRVTYFNSRHYHNNPIRVLPQRIFSYPMSIYFPKNSYLKDPFDREIQNFASAGVFINWLRRYIDKKFLNEKNHQTTEPYTGLTNADLLGCYHIMNILMIISCIVFFLEIISKRVPALEKVFEYFSNE